MIELNVYYLLQKTIIIKGMLFSFCKSIDCVCVMRYVCCEECEMMKYIFKVVCGSGYGRPES